MPHIIILDENGVEIGREPHEPGSDLAATEEDHAATKVVLNIGKIVELHGINTNKGKDTD